MKLMIMLQYSESKSAVVVVGNNGYFEPSVGGVMSFWFVVDMEATRMTKHGALELLTSRFLPFTIMIIS
jgi:hypothetical protein